MNKVKDNYIFLSLLIFTICGALVRLLGLGDYYYSYDEMWHVYVAKQPTLSSIFYVNLTEDGHPILPYFIWHYLLQIWDNPWMARLPSLIAGIISIPIAYFMGKELFQNKHGGLFAAFFIAFSKVMIEQSQVVRGYSLMMLFLIIAFWAIYIYDRKPELKYIITYFVSMLLASLCEFAIAPVIVFTSSFLLYSAWKKSPAKNRDLAVCGIINLVILAYLVLFQWALIDIGNIDFGKNVVLRQKSIFMFVFYQFAALANGMGFSYFFNYAFLIVGVLAVVVLGGVCFGASYIYKNKKYSELALVISFLLVSAILYLGNKLPLFFPRRNIGMVIPTIILFYYGARHFYSRNVTMKKFALEPMNRFSTLLMGLSVIFLISFIAYPEKSRNFYNEFSYKNQIMEEFFGDLDKNASGKDIVLTHGIVSYYFWERFGKDNAQAAAPEYLLYKDYKVPVYSFNTDYRVCSGLCINFFDMQKLVKTMVAHKVLTGNSNQIVWMASLFSGNNTFYAIKPLKYGNFAKTKEELDKSKISDDEKIVYGENIDFKNWLTENSVKTIIKENCVNLVNDKCNLTYVIYGIRAKDLIRKMNTTTYHDPFELLYR